MKVAAPKNRTWDLGGEERTAQGRLQPMVRKMGEEVGYAEQSRGSGASRLNEEREFQDSETAHGWAG